MFPQAGTTSECVAAMISMTMSDPCSGASSRDGVLSQVLIVISVTAKSRIETPASGPVDLLNTARSPICFIRAPFASVGALDPSGGSSSGGAVGIEKFPAEVGVFWGFRLRTLADSGFVTSFQTRTVKAIMAKVPRTATASQSADQAERALGPSTRMAMTSRLVMTHAVIHSTAEAGCGPIHCGATPPCGPDEFLDTPAGLGLDVVAEGHRCDHAAQVRLNRFAQMVIDRAAARSCLDIRKAFSIRHSSRAKSEEGRSLPTVSPSW